MTFLTAFYFKNYENEVHLVKCVTIGNLQERPESKKASFLGKVSSLSQVTESAEPNDAKDNTSNILQWQVVSAKANEAKDKAEAFKAQRAQRHDRCFTLLVIDDQNTDWSKVSYSCHSFLPFKTWNLV